MLLSILFSTALSSNLEYCSRSASVLSSPNVALLLASMGTVQVLGDLEGVHGGRQFSSSLIA